jgi:hypothetical protein
MFGALTLLRSGRFNREMVNKLGLCWFRINFAKLQVLSGVLSVLIVNLIVMTRNIILFKLTAADMKLS